MYSMALKKGLWALPHFLQCLISMQLKYKSYINELVIYAESPDELLKHQDTYREKVLSYNLIDA